MKTIEFKQLAHGVNKALETLGYEVPHSVLLQAFARAAGQTNWQVLAQKLSTVDCINPALVLSDTDREYLLSLVQAEEAIAAHRAHVSASMPQGLVSRLSERREASFERLIDAARRVIRHRGKKELPAAIKVLGQSVKEVETGGFSDYPIVRLGDKPLDRAALEALEARFEDQVIAIVELELDTLIEGSFEDFLDALSERLSGTLALVDFSYDVVSIANPTDLAVAFRVTGRIDWDILGDSEEEDVTKSSTALRVFATVETDDRAFSCRLDVTEWFEQASEADLSDVLQWGFGPGEATDPIGLWAYDQGNRDIEKLFDYIERMNRNVDSDLLISYLVSVEEESALAWVKANKPELLSE